MAETFKKGDPAWIEGTFKVVTNIDENGNRYQRVKVKVDRAFLLDDLARSGLEVR